jgi:hypothetical protein
MRYSCLASAETECGCLLKNEIDALFSTEIGSQDSDCSTTGWLALSLDPEHTTHTMRWVVRRGVCGE